MENLTEDEKKIIKALSRLEKLWKKHGKGLILYNGNDLRRGHSISHSIATFPGIKGDGGDGGDNF